MVTMAPAAPWAAYLRFCLFGAALSQPCDKLCAMTEDLDFRSDKSDSAEGGRIAVDRWAGYHHNLDEDVVAEAFSTPGQSMEELDPRSGTPSPPMPSSASELIGFWVAWHLAGGFDNLERGGLAPGDHLPQGPPLPRHLRRPPRRVRLPLDPARPRHRLVRADLPPARSGPQPRLLRLTSTVSDPCTPSDQLVANMQLQGPASGSWRPGVDALYLSGRAELPKRFLARLEDCRAWAAEAKRPAPCEIGEHTFGIAPHGWGKYRFCLDHHMARIGFSTSRHLPTVRVQPRSEFLHAVGPEAAVATLREVLESELGQLRLWVNRVDLFADWQGWTLSLDDAHRFVCRADARRTYEVGGTLTGFEFGCRKTKTFLARLYDKTADMAAKDTGWWHEVWGERYVPRPARPPARVRVRAPGTGRVRPQHAGPGPRRRRRPVGLCHRGMADLPLPHQRPDPLPLAPRPRVAPGPRATLGHQAVGLERLRLARRATSIEKLLPGLTGYLASLGALIGTEGIDDTLGAIGHHLHTYEIVSHTPFADRVARRRSELELR